MNDDSLLDSRIGAGQIIDGLLADLDWIGRTLPSSDKEITSEHLRRWLVRATREMSRFFRLDEVKALQTRYGEVLNWTQSTQGLWFAFGDCTPAIRSLKNFLIALKGVLDYRPGEILHNGEILPSELQVEEGGMILGGQYYNALKIVLDIFKTATNSITVVDRYFSAENIPLFPQKKPPLDIRLLTDNKFVECLKVAAVVNKQYDQKILVRESSECHDRFVVIDEKKYYHFGSSIDESHGKRVTLYTRLEQRPLIDAFREWFKSVWDAASRS